jgi:hypothetical protein
MSAYERANLNEFLREAHANAPASDTWDFVDAPSRSPVHRNLAPIGATPAVSSLSDFSKALKNPADFVTLQRNAA